MSPIPEEFPGPAACTKDPEYLDAFLQGARFALFALEGRLRDDDEEIPAEIEKALLEFHDLYKDTRSGVEAEKARVELFSTFLGKN